MDWLNEAIARQATPKHLREGTVEEFCAKYGITTQSFYYELSKDESKKKILELALNKAKESVPEVLEVLIERAKAGDMKAIDIYLDSVIQLAKNLDIKSDGKPIIQLANEIAEKNGIK